MIGKVSVVSLSEPANKDGPEDEGGGSLFAIGLRVGEDFVAAERTGAVGLEVTLESFAWGSLGAQPRAAVLLATRRSR
jgi:hypothetical protein